MPVTLIAALKKDINRKPSKAIWDLLREQVHEGDGTYVSICLYCVTSWR